jgi:VIT1/CCC1 family predicted Fe2+/Mn2+ transporter
VFGVSDGLVTNVSLILGVAGGQAYGGYVRLAGLAGLIAGALSMAAGEYNSMRVQSELLERELAIERVELRRNPNVERAELARIYESRGVRPDRALAMATELMADPEVALQTHAREELGIDPTRLGSPKSAALASLLAFALGGLIPLVPWLFAEGTAPIVASVALAVVASVALGFLIARFTNRSPYRTAARQLLLTAVAAATTWGIGHLIGINVH